MSALLRWELMPSEAFYDEHPWKLLCGTDYNGEPLILASVGGYTGDNGKEHWSWVSDWPFTLMDDINSRDFPTREAAQAAAKSAFKDWLRAVVGEPVAFVGDDFSMQWNPCNGAVLAKGQALYALDTGEKG